MLAKDYDPKLSQNSLDNGNFERDFAFILVWGHS